MLVKVIMNLAIIALILVHSVSLQAEIRLDNWKTYTSLANVKSVSLDNMGRIWAGTSGGVFVYNLNTEEINEIRNTEGLLSLDVSCVKSSEHDNSIFIGSSNGVLQIHKDDVWEYITDISNSDYPDPVIHDILFVQDYAYIAGGFGLSKFSLDQHVFIESVERFGEGGSNTKVFKIITLGGYLWAATERGAARTSLNNSISNPKSWELFSAGEGIIENKVISLASLNGTLYAATPDNIYKFTGEEFIHVIKSKDGAEITGLSEFEGKLVYSTKIEVYDLENQSLNFGRYRSTNGIFKISGESGDELIMMFKKDGFSLFSDGVEREVLPNTPITNNFVNMDVDKKGRLWIATKSKSVSDGSGFMMMDEKGNWTNFNNNYNDIINNQCLKIKSLDNGKVYVSSWGSGLIVLSEKDGEFELSKYDNLNSPLTGAITTSPDFVITGEVFEDVKGRLWIINYGETNPGPILLSLDKQGEFTDYNNNSMTERGYLEIDEDQWGTKWLGSYKSQGLLYFNDNGTPLDKSDDIVGTITKSSSGSTLLDNEQTAIEIDKNGFIWIGTSSGLNFIYDSYSIINNGNIIIREESNMRSQYIHDIYIDALDNKWIATNKGVWVLNRDGSELLNEEIINSQNSPLINDEVITITSDPSTGVMYFGTKYGLSAANSLSVIPEKEYDIRCYPQPFNPLADIDLFIDGLMENSDIRILTIDGKLVRGLTAQGRIAVWDGKDENGILAASGVYIVVSSSGTSEGSGAGKFTVVRK